MCKTLYREIARTAQKELEAVLIKPQGPTTEEVEAAYAKYHSTLASASEQVKALPQ